MVMALLMPCTTLASAGDVGTVKAVRIEGNQRIEDDAILRVIKTHNGDVYASSVLSEDIEAIYKMGYFDDVRVSVEPAPDGNTVIFTVQEKPTVREIEISGNRVYDDEEIIENIDISTGSILNIYRIKRNVEAIETLYKEKNYHNVEVTYKTEELANNQADLEFIIKEGEKVRIREIRIEGNQAFDNKALKKIMKTSEKGFFSWLTSSGDLDPETLEQDIMRLTAFYLNDGYAEVRVAEPEIEFKDESIDITIKIDEGNRFRIGSVAIEGDLIEPRPQLMEKVKIDQQTWFNQEVIRNDVLTLTDVYADQGFARADISPQIRKQEGADVIDMVYRVEKNQPIFFEEIVIEGNTKTRDKVLRRELKVVEGERYSATDLKRSVRNLYRLDYFENIDIKTLPGSTEDQMLLKIDVEEKPTGTFSFGAGYSAVDKLYVMAAIQERNLFGRGQYLELKAQTGSRTQQFSVSFTEPWLFDIPLSAGVSAYKWERDYDEYTRDSTGGELRFGYPLADYTRGYLSYAFDVSDIDDIDPGYQFLIEEGTLTESSVTASVVYDSLDRAINPTEGSKLRTSLQYAGLGGDVGFGKLTSEAGRYFPLFFGTVFFLHGEGGYVERVAGKILPDYEKFYLGGINSLRGFDWRDVSAFEVGVDGIPYAVGGEKYVQFNAEFIFPIIKSAGFMGLVFYDTGNVYKEGDPVDLGELRESAGYGIRWYSPLGPIRLERGYIIDRQEGEASGRWEFSIGGAF